MSRRVTPVSKTGQIRTPRPGSTRLGRRMVAPAPAAPQEPTKLQRFLALDLLDNRYPALHGLRVCAIVTVVQWHVTWILSGEQHIPIHQGFFDASLTFFFGMDLFFVLSGFLI